jgi:hypothetical protein
LLLVIILIFVTGGLSEQFQQAMTHVAKTIDAAVKHSEDE